MYENMPWIVDTMVLKGRNIIKMKESRKLLKTKLIRRISCVMDLGNHISKVPYIQSVEGGWEGGGRKGGGKIDAEVS